MRILRLIVVALIAASAFGQSSGKNGGGGAGVSITTVAGLASVSGKTNGTIAVITNGNSATDCTVGGGSTNVTCQFNGTIWAQLVASSSGGTAFSALTGSTNTSAAMVCGTGCSLAVSGSGTNSATHINGTSMAGLGTGIYKNTTGTGAPSIAIAGDFPTFNQSTTGSAATLTTTRAIAGNNFNGSADTTFANKFLVQGTADAGLTAAQFMGALATGFVKNTVTTGVQSIATPHDFAVLLNCNDSSGSGTAQLCTTTPTFVPAAGDTIIYKTTTTNTGALTINVNSSSAAPARKWMASAALVSGDVILGVYNLATFDGTNWNFYTIGNAPGGAVSTVFGRSGTVVAAANDYTLDLIGNPAADKTFTFPQASTSGLTVAGTAPASVSTATGTNAPAVLTVNGVTGGADSNATGTAGIGSSPSVTAGNGGAGTGTNAVGGAGGGISVTAGNGGASLGTGVNSNGGNIIVTPGTAGTGGSGTAGKSGVFQVAGANAGFFGLQQGAANTSANIQLPANVAVYQAPVAVTSHFVDVPGAAPTNSSSGWYCSNANPAICIWSKLQQLTITTGTAYSNASTTFSDVKGSTGQTLSFAVEANTNYQMQCQILWQGSATTTGPKFQFTGPASPTALVQYMHSPVTTSTYLDAVGSTTAFSSAMPNTGTITATTNFLSTVTLGLINGANAGTVILQAAANGAGTLTIQDGSFCVLQ